MQQNSTDAKVLYVLPYCIHESHSLRFARYKTVTVRFVHSNPKYQYVDKSHILSCKLLPHVVSLKSDCTHYNKCMIGCQ